MAVLEVPKKKERKSIEGSKRITLTFSKPRHMQLYAALEQIASADYDRPLDDTVMIVLQRYFDSAKTENSYTHGLSGAPHTQFVG